MRTAWTICVVAALTALSCTSKLDGPAPEVSGVAPDIICTAQSDQTITISGSGFSPAVVDGLKDSREVAMPRVILIAADGSENEIPPANVSLAGNTSGTSLEVIVPQAFVAPSAAGDSEAVYDIRVINPNGHEGALSDGLTIVPPPSIALIDPSSGAQGQSVDVVLTGSGFRDGMTVTLDASPAVSGTAVTLTDATEASTTFDLTNVAPGTYDITVTNGDGCTFTLSGAFTVFIPIEFTLVGIDPPFGCTCDDTTVTITSEGGFASTPRVEMRPNGQNTPVIAFENVAFIDANTITAVVPGGAEVGSYDVTVINPPSDAGLATLENAFEVVALPVPTIEAIVPSRGSPTLDTLVTIFGENFRPNVKVELIDRDGNFDATVNDITTVSGDGTEITVTMPTSGMIEDAYLVRVTNLDENTYSTFSSFLVAESGPSGNLHGFADEPSLLTGRRMLAGATAKDTSGNSYLYAIGGDTGATAGTVLASVEVSQLAKFGQLSSWADNVNLLNLPRVGAAAVAVPLFDDAVSLFTPIKTYIYVLGGMDDQGTVLDSIERAVMLSPDDAPSISIAASTTAGNLEAGTWYYKVSAVLAAGDPDNPAGETLPSDEAILTIGTNTGSIDVSWDAITVNGIAAASYRIYRTDAVNGASQGEHLIAEVSGTSYTDSGDVAGIESPLAPGATGVWVTEAGTMTSPRWGHQALLNTDSDGNRLLYVAGGKNNATDGYLSSVTYAAVGVDGSLGALGAGAGGNAVSDLPEGRAFFSLVNETPQNVSGYVGDGRLMVLGGIVAGGTATADFLLSDVTLAGGNAAWTDYAGASNILVRGGPMSVITSEKLFVFGGAGMTTDTTFSAILAGARDVGFLANGNLSSPIQDAAVVLTPARALGVSLLGSGFIYLVGGTSDGDNALTSSTKTF